MATKGSDPMQNTNQSSSAEVSPHASRRSVDGDQAQRRKSLDADGRGPVISSLRGFFAPGSALTRTSLTAQGSNDAELRQAAEEAHARWRNGDASESGRKKFKPHRLAIVEERGSEKGASFKEVDVKKFTVEDQKDVVSKAMATQDPDYQPFLKRLHERMHKVGIELSTVEVRFEELEIETSVFVGSRALPSVTNRFRDYAQFPLTALGVKLGGKANFPILKKMTGVLKPGRFTLLLGPPGSGKSTLLKALSGKLDMGSLRVRGDITFNGHTMDEFVIQRTAAYIEQRDTHIAELSVRETLDFAARVQGVGHKREELDQLMRLEAEQNIVPDPEIDAFMKAEAQLGTRYSVVTELMLRLLGLDYVANTLIGGEMIRGVSGGQKKRVTTGEMIVGPCKTLMLDEISTGLDSSTTYQITKILGNFAHMRQATVLLALLQPAPEVYNQFDDILLLSEGSLVFHGPREEVLPFFESLGFKLPERKGVADFLQEVTSRKDQAQYWFSDKPYRFVPVVEMAEAFQRTQAAQRTRNIVEMPYDRAASPAGALVKQKYGLPRQKALRATLRREILLIQRNSFIYVFRFFQVILNALMTSTLFFRTTRHPNSLKEANYYMGVLFFSLISMLFNNWAEFQLLVDRLPVFYKQRDNKFYPTWTFAVPTIILSIPQAILESLVWSSIVYWVVGLQPAASGWATFWLFNFLMHQFAVALFRLVGAACQTSALANATSVVVTLLVLLNGGFILPRTSVRWWWRWFFYINPLSWSQRSVALNEFRAPRWQNQPGPTPGSTMGDTILQQRGFENTDAWIWVGVPFMIGAIIVLNIAIIFCLAVLDSPDKPGGGLVSEEELAEKNATANGHGVADDGTLPGKDHAVSIEPVGSSDSKVSKSALSSVEPGSAFKSTKSMAASVEQGPVSFRSGGSSGEAMAELGRQEALAAKKTQKKGDSTLPFDQLWLSFHHVWYSVDLPPGRDPTPGPRTVEGEKESEPRLYLLSDVSGAFRPNVLTALVGETGAGKTTLMDVLAGRKTGGRIEGDVRVQGHPKEQQTFARVSGYCEQNDIHSPQTTVEEALLFSGSLRLPRENDPTVIKSFVREIMDIVELTPLAGALVGLPGRSGLSVEQRKRLTIAVELVANPSIVFMDEPTSGLDARAAAIVMRAVRNTVDTGRTVVCTIHQPSIDIFEAFDELLLMKRGGRIIFHGPLGQYSAKLVEYFSSFKGVEPIEEGYNPATWVLDITNQSQERRLGLNFADEYEKSELYRRTEVLVEELSVPPDGTHPLSFATHYSRNFMGQFKICLWKNNAVYWRSPDYNSVRFFFTFFLAILFGTEFFAVGRNRSTENDILTIAGALFAANMFLGVYNASSVQPVVSVERSVFYRERAAGMYSALPYAFAQGIIELPYIMVQSVFFVLIVYSMVRFEWTGAKFFWFLLFETMSLVLFTFYGIVSVSLTPNLVVASIISGTTYFIFALFCGFIIQAPSIPGWWIWMYYADPVSWILYGTVTSQLGDVTTMMMRSDGTPIMVQDFILSNFGFHHDLLGLCVAVLACMTLLCWGLTMWSLSKINWERR